MFLVRKFFLFFFFFFQTIVRCFRLIERRSLKILSEKLGTRTSQRQSSRVFSTKYSVSKGIKFNMYSRIWIDSIPSPNQRGRCFEEIECCARECGHLVSCIQQSNLAGCRVEVEDRSRASCVHPRHRWNGEKVWILEKGGVCAPLSFYFGKQRRSSDCWWMEKNKCYRVFVCRDRNFPREGIYWK